MDLDFPFRMYAEEEDPYMDDALFRLSEEKPSHKRESREIASSDSKSKTQQDGYSVVLPKRC